MKAKTFKVLRKLLNVILTFGIFALLIFAIITEQHSLMWLMIGVIVLHITLVSIATRRRKRFTIPPLANYLSIVTLLSFVVHREYTGEQKQSCQISLGVPFNKERTKYGVPILPDNWRKDDSYANWFKKTDGDGHNAKYVSVNNEGCKIAFERDDYYLPDGDSARYLSVLTKYGKSVKPDSIIFSYYLGNSVKVVNRHFADSLLTAEHIRKDF